MALAILAASMTIFIGLQAAAVQRTIRDSNVQQAMLAARKIMAMLDTNPALLDQGNIPPTPLANIYAQLGFPPARDQAEIDAINLLQGALTVEPWTLPVPDIGDPPLRKLVLVIAWGPDPAERFELVYYIPMPV